MRVNANCLQTPDGRGQAGGHLNEIKSKHWPCLEKEKGLLSDLEEGRVSQDSHSWRAYSCKSRRGLSAMDRKLAGRWEERMQRSKAACDENGMSQAVLNSPVGLLRLRCSETPNV